MRRVFLVIVSMVLLSGVAWGQPKDALIIGGMNGTKDLTMEWHIANMHPEWVKSGNTFYLWYEPKKSSVLKGHMEDPTAWKQFGSVEKYCEEKCSVKHSDKWATVYGECEQQCLRQYKAEEPWSNSRFRLEKNEVTGKCRVTEFRDNRWKPAHEMDIFSGRSCEEALNDLEEYRQSEREDRAWKPIR